MRVPYVENATKLDIAMIGIPFDGGVTNRPGARHGPREVRNMSSLIRRVHHVTGVNPFEICRIGDAGDTPVNPVNLLKALDLITNFFEPLAAAGDNALLRRRSSNYAANLSRNSEERTGRNGSFRCTL